MKTNGTRKKRPGTIQLKLAELMEKGTQCIRVYPDSDRYVHKDSARMSYQQAIKSTGYPFKVYQHYGDLYLTRTDM